MRQVVSSQRGRSLAAMVVPRAPSQYKTRLSQVWGFPCQRWPSCLVHPSVRDKSRMTEIDLSQPRHATAFWWRHNWPVTSQLTDRIKWPNHPLDLIGINMHISTQQRIPDTKMSYIDKCTTVFDILVHIHMVWVLMISTLFSRNIPALIATLVWFI